MQTEDVPNSNWQEKFGSGFVKSSGDKGGTPMFSRVGKQTISESMCF